MNQVGNDTLRARARAVADIAHLKLVQSVDVEVDKVGECGNTQLP